MGVLSALPLVSAGNLCCCLWVVIGGAIAAYLLQQNQSTPIAPGDGALVGLLAGLIGALVQFVVSIPIGILVAPLERAMLERIVEMAGSMPPEMRDALGRYTGARGEFSVAMLIVRKVAELVMWLFVGLSRGCTRLRVAIAFHPPNRNSKAWRGSCCSWRGRCRRRRRGRGSCRRCR
jgi:hypothetical protein